MHFRGILAVSCLSHRIKQSYYHDICARHHENAFELSALTVLCHISYCLPLSQGGTQYFKVKMNHLGVLTAVLTVFSGHPVVYIADRMLYPNVNAGSF